eukprot:gene11597-biopygen5641
MKTKAGGEQIIRVREFLHDSVSVYSEDDLRFADGSSLDDDGSNFTSSKLYTSSHPTHAAVGTTVPLLPVNITVDSSNSKDNMLNEDMNSYWQSDISGGRPWIQITLPPRAGTGAVFPELQLYTMDHDIYSPNNISISTGADSSSLVKLKDMTLSTASQWNTLVTSDEFKNAAAAKGPVRVVRISITDNHSGGGESRVSGVRLVNTAVPQFSRQLSVGERVVLSPSFSENQGDGWCLGKVSDVKTGVIICVPDTPSKFTEQRDIVVLSDDNDDKSLQLSVFRASWLERSPPPIDLIPGQLVQLNPATWRDDNIHTNVKCLGVLEDKRGRQDQIEGTVTRLFSGYSRTDEYRYIAKIERHQVEVPGATEVLVYFDKQSSTENGHDYVKLYKDDSHTSYWGEEKYTGNVFPAPSEEPRVTPPYQIPPADIASKGLAESMVFESSHPYSENTDEYTVVEIPGAMGYSISFDPQSCTETNFDFVRFYKDDTHTERWGEDKYSGSGSSKNFPGCEGRPPLEIPASRFVMYFHSDGSANNWGYKITATKATVFIPKVLSVGDKVVRGKNWQWGNQDGGEGKTGVVLDLPDISGLINIQWDASGNIYSYRYGNDNLYDVQAVDSEESTITDTDATIVSAISLDNELRNSDGVLVQLGSESENNGDIGEKCSKVYYC